MNYARGFHSATGARGDARQRGFATLVAVTMIPLLAVALVVLMSQLKDVSDDARLEMSRVQLRQLLLTGGQIAPEMVLGGEESMQVSLPESLMQAGASLQLQRTIVRANIEMHVDVTAMVGGRAAAQRLRYLNTPRGWALAEVMMQ